MKNLQSAAANLSVAGVLSREQMKHVLGGVMPLPPPGGSPGGNNGNPCANGGCSTICHQTSSGDDKYNQWGSCSAETGGVSCHNYCCADSAQQATYWC